MNDEEFAVRLRQELDRRIAELSTYGDGTFGRLGGGDWALIAILFVALPLAIVWWAR